MLSPPLGHPKWSCLLLVAAGRPAHRPKIPALCPLHDQPQRTSSKDPAHTDISAEHPQQLELPPCATNCECVGAMVEQYKKTDPYFTCRFILKCPAPFFYVCKSHSVEWTRNGGRQGLHHCLFKEKCLNLPLAMTFMLICRRDKLL